MSVGINDTKIFENVKLYHISWNCTGGFYILWQLLPSSREKRDALQRFYPFINAFLNHYNIFPDGQPTSTTLKSMFLSFSSRQRKHLLSCIPQKPLRQKMYVMLYLVPNRSVLCEERLSICSVPQQQPLPTRSCHKQ